MGGGLHPPIDLIETWHPNYKNPETRGHGVEYLCAILLPIVFLVVGMRIWARFVMGRNWGVDDVLIIFNMIPLTALNVAVILAQRYFGFNKHIWDNPIPTIVNSRKIAMAIEALYLVSTSITKVSILLFYRRLAKGTVSRTFLWCVYTALAFIACYFIIFTINLYVTCRPLPAFWKQVDIFWNMANEHKYHCFDEGANLVAATSISVIQDFIACGLPSILLWKTRIPPRQKIALGLIFGVGFFLCICGALRIYYIIRIYYFTYDMTWGGYIAWVWLALESNLGVICASAPALKVFFKRTLQVSSVTGSWLKRSKGSEYGRTLDTAPNGGITLTSTFKTQSYVAKSHLCETEMDRKMAFDVYEDEMISPTTKSFGTTDAGTASDYDSERGLSSYPPISPTMSRMKRFSPGHQDFHVPRRLEEESGRTFYIDK